MKTSILASFSVLSAATYAKPIESNFGPYVVKNSVSQTIVKQRLTEAGAPNPDSTIQLHFGLKQNNIEGAVAELHDRSNPSSANYGKWLSQEEIYEYTKPTNLTLTTVKQWLASLGFDESSVGQPYPDWLAINVTIARAEQILNTKYAQYSHPDLAKPLTRALSYSLPESLHAHIDTVQPTTGFSLPPKRVYPSGEPTNSSVTTRDNVKRDSVTCNPLAWTKECFLAYYSVNWTPANRPGAQVGAMIFQASASPSDAALYYGNGRSFGEIVISGSPNPGQASGEANLDTQFIGIAQPNDAYAVVAENPINDGLMDISNWIASQPSALGSTSSSFSFSETGSDVDYMIRVCNNFMTGALAGRTVFVASGDYGCGGANCRNFGVEFPQTCPYVVTVGGTMTDNDGSSFPASGDGRVGEVAVTFANNGGSGAGFSNVFAQPSYQQEVVQHYITGLNGYFDNLYNKSGRAYPDISAFAFPGWDYYFNGQLGTIGGTSASAPALAAFFSILNDERVSQGKSTVGWLNPQLYGPGLSAIMDVTKGNGGGGCGTGFPTAVGWDAVTGLGTPNYAVLVNAIP